MIHSHVIDVQPLSRDGFDPFGKVISFDGAASFPINSGRTDRYHAQAVVDLLGDEASAVISLFRGRPLAEPVVTALERHPLGSQTFMPLSSKPYWVVVAPVGEFDISRVCAFLAQGSQGVHYPAGLWHAPLMPTLADSDFLVVDRSGPGENCDIVNLDVALMLGALQ